MLLKVKDLTKTYIVGGLFRKKNISAVRNVSFNVNQSEFISIVGESGSGKTTLSRMILRLIRPTSGEIIFEEKHPWKLSKLEDLKWYWRQVHGIFQDPFSSFNPLYKTKRVLYQTFNLMKIESKKDRAFLVEEALKKVGLGLEILERYPHELSGGQRQRIMIARCYIVKPKMIVADEPVSMIDASTRAGILKLFTELRDNFKTSILFITHDLGLAYYISDKIMIMHNGMIVEEGTPNEILDNPKHEQTISLSKNVPLLYKKWEMF